MKNILYSLLAIFILNNAAIAQLMTDEQHRTMMNTYSTTLNNILSTTCPEGMSIDQYKRRLITGEMPALLPSLQSDIITAAEPLKTYGAQFAAAKGLAMPSDDYKYFYAAFAPSTNVSGGKLVESTTTAGITSIEMWESAASSFTTNDCGSSALVTDKNNVYTLANTCIGKVATGIVWAGVPGVLLMVNGFSDRLHHYYQLEQAGFAMAHDATYANTLNTLNTFNNQPKNQAQIDQLTSQDTLTTSDLESLAAALGFPNKAAMDSFQCSIKSNLDNLKGNYISPYATTNGDEAIIFNAVDRFTPAQLNSNLSVSGKQMGNFGTTLLAGSCSNFPINEPLGRPEQIKCVENFMIDMISTLPIIGCRDVILNTGNAIFNGASYTTGQFLYELAGCGFGFTPFKQLQVGVTLGTFIYCIISER